MEHSEADMTWDVIVIGAGLGGGLCGRALAEAGLSVLFVDRGTEGDRGATGALDGSDHDPGTRHLRGCWPTRLHGSIDGRQITDFALQGTGPGGTSVFYAASLERPERHDLEPTAAMPHPTGGWPVGYDEFRPWFDRAQDVMMLSGTDDPLRADAVAPLRPPPPLSPAEAALVAQMEARGLHPYRMHLAIRGGPGCMECIGHKCPMDCKRDGRSAGVEPALATGRAVFMGDTVVQRLCGDRSRITHVEAECAGKPVVLRARIFVLAAGGLGSAHLLLASASPDWPQGCANDSGLVGRGLMFHLGERVAIWPPRGLDRRGALKTLCLRDFYAHDGRRLGLFQSMGLPASYGNIVQILNDRYDNSPLRRFRPGRELTRIPAWIAARLLGEARIFCGILEDLPVDENRLTYDPAYPQGFTFTYRVSDDLRERRAMFRRRIRQGLRGLRSLFLSHEVELNLAHPCGTARFSDDPKRGVLDRDCKAHGLDNLYVADSSFMPTSTGVNPSLTIVANALRVADVISRRLEDVGTTVSGQGEADAPPVQAGPAATPQTGMLSV
ncbi:GMC family oxidoreductase [Paracoccus sp. Z118]|uniref:GMC oxidoreductase n=1 Tax=Paracoccus sp. Z118 TaxID=2851017 RepID=UPI001C2BC02D|nr:GMC family oxidoreductase [Paracoccus sp. Z118]MBV0891404.1 GMC family oxidoreductase [Paracoccus sp. Z118]